MVKKCCVRACPSESYGGCNISFHSFPKNEEMREKWLRTIPVTQNITKYSFVCSRHFEPSSFYTANSRQLLKANAIPTICPADHGVYRTTQCRSMERCCRLCGARAGAGAGARLQRRDLAGFYETFSPCGLGRNLSGREHDEWVCPYCWARASQCIKFIECVRTSELALNDMCDNGYIIDGTSKFHRYSIFYAGSVSICDSEGCAENSLQNLLSIEHTYPESDFEDLVTPDDFKCEPEPLEFCVADYESIKLEPTASGDTELDPSNDLKDEKEVLTYNLSKNRRTYKKELAKSIQRRTRDKSRKKSKKLKCEKKVVTEKTDLTFRKKTERKTDDVFKKLGMEKLHYTREDQLNEIERKKNADKFLCSPHPCYKCGQSFKFAEAYGNHQKKHDESSGPYECDVCKFRLPSLKVLQRHVTAHSLRRRCLRCAAVLGSYRKCLAHYEKCSDAAQPSKCNECGKIFSAVYKLKRHIYLSHQLGQRFACHQCGKMYKYKSALKQHILSHTGEKPFECETCGKKTVNLYTLQKHIKTHEPAVQKEDAYCVECDQFFRSNLLLQTHLKTSLRHVSKDTFKHACSACTERFVDASSLNIHMRRVHLNTRTYQCTLCDKAYFSQGTLRAHMRNKHLDIVRRRDQLCTICGKAFLSKVTLQQHKLAVHTKERPFACQLCPATFGFKASLYTHNKLKHKMKT